MANKIINKNYINSKDLNLLRVFALLLADGNVSRVAQKLRVTQPAISRALARLRDEFADPMFVRSPQGMLPTAKAASLEQPLLEALTRLEALYEGPKAFSPASATGVVRIATTDYFEQVVWVDLVGKLASEAPGLTFVTLMTGAQLQEGALRSGEVQLAIAGFFGELPSGFMRQTILTDKFVTVVRKGHPKIKKKKLTLETFCNLGHVIVSPQGDLEGAVDVSLRKAGYRRHVAASVCSFLSSGPLIASSDLILTAPARLVERFVTSLPLETFEPPIELPPINVVQIWHERFQADPMHIWLRAAIRDMAAAPKRKGKATESFY